MRWLANGESAKLTRHSTPMVAPICTMSAACEEFLRAGDGIVVHQAAGAQSRLMRANHTAAVGE